jgi:radical SAM protein with 4Fe4S-binding SPASM domain
MKFDDFKTMFDPVKDYALSIALYNWGEPFLNKRLFDIIAYATEKKVGTTLHSNFNHFNEAMAEEVIRSGLTHLYLSIDGATQDVYSTYRVKGDISNVKEHICMMVDRKKKANSKLPFITWKYLKFPHNAHQVEAARKMAGKLEVTNFEVFDANPKVRDIYDQAEEYLQHPAKFNSLKDPCQSLWASVYIGPDGTVFPCSLAFRETESFGNLMKSDFMSVWNNGTYQSARSLFGKSPVLEGIPYPCRGCKYFLKCLNGF